MIEIYNFFCIFIFFIFLLFFSKIFIFFCIFIFNKCSSSCIEFIIYDNRDKALGHGNYQEVILGKDNYARLTIPPMVWVGFQGFSDAKSMLLNIADIEHSKEEVLRLDQHEIDYKWRNFI